MQSAKRQARKKARRRGVRAWAHWWLFPPGLWEIGRRFVPRELAANRALSPPEHPTPLVNILFPQPVPDPSETYWIPVEKIVSGFGRSFTTEQHHFVRYLESGFDDLERFYRIHQPQTAFEARFIDESPGPAGVNVRDVPWRQAPLADTVTRVGLPVAFGPVSDLQIATEADRLKKLRRSINKYGFLPRHPVLSGGQITSQLFYKDDGDFRVVIANGNHRTAVLAHLGWKLIPVGNKPGSHPVRLSDLERWPGVVDGRFSREAARTMFEAFFRPRHQQLLPGW